MTKKWLILWYLMQSFFAKFCRNVLFFIVHVVQTVITLRSKNWNKITQLISLWCLMNMNWFQSCTSVTLLLYVRHIKTVVFWNIDDVFFQFNLVFSILRCMFLICELTKIGCLPLIQTELLANLNFVKTLFLCVRPSRA